MFTGRFGTALMCMDGRVQMPVIRYMKNRFAIDYVDIISEPGMNRLIAESTDPRFAQSLLEKVRISINRHGSRLIAVVGHHDCVGNPAPHDKQCAHTRAAIKRLAPALPPDIAFCGLWVNERWSVIEVPLEPKPAFSTLPISGGKG